ncbi:hypothetical protein BJ165DRAFT_1528857 [Panaeolus papilionaceus]|nr:hypothetical protein BJ165DRAFT_1528857 [Panaeolus papilionaceus]
MSLHAKVVFPTPPPTTNALTPEQRIQLVRKTRKIEQIFGTTPYLLDSPIETLGAFHVHFPTQTRISKDSKTKTRTSSMDSSSSDSSSNSPVKLSLQRNPRSDSPRNTERRSSSRPSTPSSIAVQESWPVNQNKSPVLRLAVQSPLDTIPASPDPTSTTFNMEPLAQALDLPTSSSPRPSSSHSDSLDFFNGVAPELASSLQSTSFIIPSRTSIRKQKLDRLRKKLGCEVPLNLILSQVGDLDDSDVSPSRPASRTDSRHQYSLQSYASSGGESPKPIPRMKKPTTAKIASARDSIEESTFSGKIHRAKRQLASAGLTKKAGKKAAAKKTRQEEVPPSPRPVISSPTDFRVIKEKLSLIIESPEEHGTGCSEEFGLSRVSTRSSSTGSSASMARSATSLFDSGDADVRMWSTRKGYEGWRPSTPSDASSTPPTTPSSPVSTQGLVRRSSSYRKPPPPVPAECL